MLLTLCEENAPVIDGFPSQRPVKRSFDAFFDARLNKPSRRDGGDFRRYIAHSFVILMKNRKGGAK